MSRKNCQRFAIFAALVGTLAGTPVRAEGAKVEKPPKAAKGDHRGEGGPAYDFTDYLKQQEFEESQTRLATEISPSVVTIKGVDYLRLEAASGTLYVPKVDRVTPEGLERGLCSSSFRPADVETATVSAVALEITRSVQAYAKLVVETIHQRCDGTASTPAKLTPTGDLEIGVTKRRPGRHRGPERTFTIFNRRLQPNIGVRSDF
jgi:hypothetical protein